MQINRKETSSPSNTPMKSRHGKPSDKPSDLPDGRQISEIAACAASLGAQGGKIALREKSNLSNGFNLIWAVQSQGEKYFASVFPK
jgi:hypothetical protein